MVGSIGILSSDWLILQVRLSQADLPSFLAAANTLQVTDLLEQQQQGVEEEEISEREQEKVTLEEEEEVSQETVVEIKEETVGVSDTTDRSQTQMMELENEISRNKETRDLKCKDTSDKVEEEEEEEDQLWDDVRTVSFEFLKSGKSRQTEGLLVTHDRNYKFSRNQTSRSGKASYYYCSERQSGCKGVISRLSSLIDPFPAWKSPKES